MRISTLPPTASPAPQTDPRLEEAVPYLNYLRFKEEWDATGEILRDKKLMRSWQRGKRQAERGQTISLNELKRRLNSVFEVRLTLETSSRPGGDFRGA